MAWMPGCPADPAPPKGSLAPQAIVLHRTYGAWPGDYSVIKGQSLCQFLIGKDDGQWVQFMETTSVAYHCNGANFHAFGIELTGINEEPLTGWQIVRLGDVLRWANATHGIPLIYTDPATTPPASIWVNGGGFSGVISHDSVRTDDGSSQHTDLITAADYARAVGSTSSGDLFTMAQMDDIAQWEKDTRKVVNDFTEQTHQVLKGEINIGFQQILEKLDAILSAMQADGAGVPVVDVAAIAKAVNDDAAARLAG